MTLAKYYSEWVRFIPQHQFSVYQEYTNFITDLTKVYKSNLCFDPKKILQIDEIEYTNTSFAFNFCIQISLLFWSLVYTNFTSVLNSKIRKNCIQIDPLTCRQIYPYTNFSPPLNLCFKLFKFTFSVLCPHWLNQPFSEWLTWTGMVQSQTHNS